MTERPKNKTAILERINKHYRIKPIHVTVFLVVSVFILMFIIGQVENVGRELTSDFVGAFISLLFAFNFSFVLFLGSWQFVHARQINKMLFPTLENLIKENERQSYRETEMEAEKMVEEAYWIYNQKYKKLKRIFWTCLIISIVISIMVLLIELIYRLL